MSLRLFITATSLLLSSFAFAQSEQQMDLTSESQSEEMLLSAEELATLDANADDLAAPDSLAIDIGYGWSKKKFVCYARSKNGRWFSAVDHNPDQAQWEALRHCSWQAKHCYAMGCNRIR